MKLLVIMKRFGANKDMVVENFGRQIRLFEPLAKKHEIDFFCPDYKKRESRVISRKGIRYIVRPVSLMSPLTLEKSLGKLVKKEKHDAIIATTDPLIGILGHRLSKKFRIPFVYELQDNFESYDSYKLPFVKHLDRKAIIEADIVIVVSDSLKKHISKLRKRPVYVINNGIDLGLFKMIGKSIARKKLKLPLKPKIIAYIGNIDRLRGGKILINAFNKVREKYPDAYLLLSGKIDKSVNLKQKNIIFRKFPKREEVVLGINSADVAVLPNPVNKFTKYSFPYKLVEYMACNVPIVATDVGDVSLILGKYDGSLCKPNSGSLAEKIIAKLEKPKKTSYDNDVRKLQWKVLSANLDRILCSLK